MDGWLTPPLAPVVAASAAVSGRALTVQLAHGTSGPGLSPIYDVLSADLADRVVVIAGARPVPGAVFGEILAGAARQQGAVGVLVDGWVRDRDDMTAIGLPVLAVGERVVGPNGSAHLLSVGQPVSIDSSGRSARHDRRRRRDRDRSVRLRAHPGRPRPTTSSTPPLATPPRRSSSPRRSPRASRSRPPIATSAPCSPSWQSWQRQPNSRPNETGGGDQGAREGPRRSTSAPPDTHTTTRTTDHQNTTNRGGEP